MFSISKHLNRNLAHIIIVLVKMTYTIFLEKKNETLVPLMQSGRLPGSMANPSWPLGGLPVHENYLTHEPNMYYVYISTQAGSPRAPHRTPWRRVANSHCQLRGVRAFRSRTEILYQFTDEPTDGSMERLVGAGQTVHYEINSKSQGLEP